jgi:hypothetical protein
VLLLTTGCETWQTIGELTIAAHLGILVFSIIQIAQSVPEALHGLKEIEEGKESLVEN